MSFIETIERARALLERNGRLSLRALRREFDLDDEALEELVEELVDIQGVARRDGKALEWMSATDAPAAAVEPALFVTEAERRQLTVLFCDLVDSTRLAAGLDPEEWREVIRAWQESCHAVIQRFDGHVARYLGDGLLVYFGWPRAHEDDAERAVRAGLGILEAMTGLNTRLHAAGRPELAVRIGVHTGPVVAGELGEETQVLGHTMNLAARLQAEAAAGTLVFSAETLRLVSGIFVTRDLGQRTLKGIAEPVHVHQAIQPSGVRSRLDLAAGRLTPFVGREIELATLVDRWERVVDGQGQTVVVTGEAGGGKSRLLYQLRERLKVVPHTWLECTCSPYTRDTAFHPVIELVEQGLAFGPKDSAAEKHAKLERGLALAGITSREAVLLSAAFLGLPAPAGEEPLDMSPELERRETMEVLAAWNLALGEIQPLVLAVEDLHWADASSVELIGRLIEQSATARVLVVATARPEAAVPWGARSNLATLQLNRLTKRHAREMVRALAAAEELPEETIEGIVERADGVALYVEELTKAVIEPGVGRGVETIPATLRDSLMARLDRLSAAKEVAQRAAVLGREFHYELLARTANIEEGALQRGLELLVEAEILFRRGTPPQATYTFKHALVQEAAYESLLKRTRQELHGRVYEALAKRAEPDAEVVARHAEAAGRTEEAIEWYQRAGERAQRHSAHGEAAMHLRRGLELVASLPVSRERDASEVPVRLALGASLIAARGYAHPEVRAVYERAEVLSEAIADAERLAETLVGLASFFVSSGDTERAATLCQRLLDLGERTDDDSARLGGHALMAVVRGYQGHLARALKHAEQAALLYDPAQHHALSYRYGTDMGVIAHAMARNALFWGGYSERSLAACEGSVELARRLNHPFSLAFALIFRASDGLEGQDFAAAERDGKEAAAIGERHGFPLWSGLGRFCAVLAKVRSQRSPEGVAEAIEGLALAGTTGNQLAAPNLLCYLAAGQHAAGLYSDAQQTIDAARAVAEQTGQHYYDAELHRLEGEIFIEQEGDGVQPEVCFRSALDVARSQAARTFELRAATSLACLWRDQGKAAEARELLAPVYGWFTEGFDTQDLRDAKALLEELG